MFLGVAMRLMLVSLAQVVLVLSPSASADTGVDCGDWPNARFFEIASPNNVLDCLATGADPNVRAGLGWTPLHVAAGFSEHPAVIEALVAAGADLEARSGLGMTPLHVAAVTERQYGNIDSVRDFETDKVLGGAYEEHSPETARAREMGSEAMEKYHKALMNHEDAENLEKLRQWIVTTTEVQESLGKTDIERDKLVAETAKTVINSEGSIGVREAKAREWPDASACCGWVQPAPRGHRGARRRGSRLGSAGRGWQHPVGSREAQGIPQDQQRLLAAKRSTLLIATRRDWTRTMRIAKESSAMTGTSPRDRRRTVCDRLINWGANHNMSKRLVR